MKKLIDEIKKSKKGKTIGVFAKENYPGSFMDLWRSTLKKESIENVKHITIYPYLILFFVLFFHLIYYFIDFRLM